jgi:hypothetical protein
MTPLLTGVFASQISGHLTPPITDFGSMEPIAMVNVGSAGASTIEFTSIPQTYKHLQIRGISKGTTSTDANITINSGTAAVRRHQLLADGSGTSSSANAGNAFIIMTTSSTGTNVFDASVIDFLDYTSTTKNKVVRVLSGRDLNGSGLLCFGSALWTTTNAITSIRLTPAGTAFAQYTQYGLYGIKG